MESSEHPAVGVARRGRTAFFLPATFFFHIFFLLLTIDRKKIDSRVCQTGSNSHGRTGSRRVKDALAPVLGSCALEGFPFENNARIPKRKL